MTCSDLIQVLLMGLLVVITGIYAWRTHVISKATKEQANASVKMAEEMREQRIMASRPVIIQKAVHEQRADALARPAEAFSHFEIYNAGNGPAIEVEVSLLNEQKEPVNAQRETFLRVGETPMKFYTTFSPIPENSTFYIVSEYQGISSYSTKPTWYQTWLPCKLSITGKVISGKLELHDDVSEENRIGIFGNMFQ